MKNAVVVRELPPGITEEKLEIYFQKRKNGGGDVESVQILDGGTEAIVKFDDESTVGTILERNHKVHGKTVKVEKHEEPQSNSIFKKVEAVISPLMLQKLQLDVIDVIQIAETCNVKIENQARRHVAVSDSLEKLAVFEKKVEQKSGEGSQIFHRMEFQSSAESRGRKPSKPPVSRMDQSPIRRRSPEWPRRDRSPLASRTSRMDQSPIRGRPHEPGTRSVMMDTDLASNWNAVAADNDISQTSEWSDSPLPQPEDGVFFTENVDTDGGDKVIKAKFCFPEGVIPIPGDFITYPSYDRVVSLPSTPAGLMVKEMLQTAFKSRKLFYIGRNTFGPGFVIQCVYNLFGSGNPECDVDLSSSLVEIRNRLKDLGIPVPHLKATNIQRSQSVPGKAVPVENNCELMDTSFSLPERQVTSKKIGPFPQPKGIQRFEEFHDKDLPGFTGSGAIHLYFRCPGGEITTDDGQKVCYESYNRSACLPGNEKGRKLYSMLKDAVQQGKLFVVAKKFDAFLIRTKARLLNSDDYPSEGYLDELYESLWKLHIRPPVNLPPLPTNGEAHFDDTPSKEEEEKERREMLRSGGPFPQPDKDGIIRMEKEAQSLKGCENSGTIKVYFRFSGGKMEVQGSRKSVSLQVQYSQVNLVTALPCDDKGKRLAVMLKAAFDEKKLFCIEKRAGEPGFRVRPRVTFLTAENYPKPSYLADLAKQLQNLGVEEPASDSVRNLAIHNSTIPQGGAVPPGWSNTLPASNAGEVMVPLVRPQAAPRYSGNGARRKTHSGLLRPVGNTDSDSAVVRKKIDDCSICLSPLIRKHSTTLLCKHAFHQMCIKRALQTRGKCPTCSKPAQITATNEFYSSSLGINMTPPAPPPGWTNVSQSLPVARGVSSASKSEEEEDKCAICLAALSAQPTKKLSCKHEFHQACIDMALKTQKKCPYCNQPVTDSNTYQSRPVNPHGPLQLPRMQGYRQLFATSSPFAVPMHHNGQRRRNPNGQFGSQPANGTMTDRTDARSLPGFEECGTIVIKYYFSSGIQQACHPNPGLPYNSTQREAYLPDTLDGRGLLQLLRRAFEAGMTFKIGRSESSGRDNEIVWNGIPHKTNIRGGRAGYGYPDQKYPFELRQSLASMGIQ